MDYATRPTVVPFPGFNPEQDAQELRKAMKGFGTDEQAIIDILCARSNAQRQEITRAFLREYGRDLIKDLKSELGGKFEDVIVGLMSPPIEYLCRQLNKAMSGLGTDETALIEVICPQNNDTIKEIVRTYEELYNRPLVQHVCSDTSGDFSRLLTLILTGVRDAPGTVNPQGAAEQAEQLFKAGEGKLGTDEEIFNKILAHASFAQLRLIFEEYKKVSGKTIEQAIKNELSGSLREASAAIVECVQSPVGFYAKRLHKAMEGMGTNDSQLIRIIVSRCEIDLGNIKAEYERLFDKTLLSAVKSETSGDYKKALCVLIGAA